MSDRFINLEIGGVPLVMYGAIATTVAVIAYATVSGGSGNSDANVMGLGTVQPVASPSPSPSPAVEGSPTTQGGKRNKKGGSKKKKDSNKKHRKTPRR